MRNQILNIVSKLEELFMLMPRENRGRILKLVEQIDVLWDAFKKKI